MRSRKLVSAWAITLAFALSVQPGVVSAKGITGTQNNDTLYGTSVSDEIDARAGNDKVYGRAGSDWIYGGGGFDQLLGEAGHDVIYDCDPDPRCGGLDQSFDILNGGTGDDSLWSDAGSDELWGGDGNDTFWVRQSTLHTYYYQKVYGGAGNDYVEVGGSKGGVYVYCGTGYDQVGFAWRETWQRSTISGDCESVAHP